VGFTPAWEAGTLTGMLKTTASGISC